MTINTPSAALEAYAAQCMRIGQYADAAAAYTEAAQNYPANPTPPQLKQQALDVLLAASAALSSRTGVGAPLPQMAPLLTAVGGFTQSGTVTQTYAGGTGGQFGAAGGFSGHATTPWGSQALLAGAGSLVANAAVVINASGSFQGAGGGFTVLPAGCPIIPAPFRNG